MRMYADVCGCMLTVCMHPVDIQYLECNRYVDKVMELVDELHISQVLTLLALLVQKSAYVSIRLYLDYKRALQSSSTSSTSARYSLYFALLVQMYQLFWYKSTST